jgi:hypothetical protein
MSGRCVLTLGATGMAVGVSALAWIRGSAEPAAIQAVAFDAFAISSCSRS